MDNSFYFSFDGVSTGVTYTKNPTDVSGDEYQWSYELVNGGYYFKNKKYPDYYMQCVKRTDNTIISFGMSTTPNFPLKTGELTSNTQVTGKGVHIPNCCFLGGARTDNGKIVQLALETSTLAYGWFTGTTAMPTSGYNYEYTSYVSYTAVGILPEYLPEYNKPLLNAAKAIITKKGVGYPSEAQRAILQAAIDADVADLTFENYKALDNAYNDYLRTDDVVMPEDGKVYAFVNVSTAGVLNYMYQGTDRLQAAAFTNIALLPAAAKFICHEKDGKYAFINSEGKYLVWGNAKTDYSGQWNLYKNDDVCAFDVKKLNAQTAAAGGGTGRERGSVEAAFGCLYLETLHRLKTADGTEESNNKGTFVIKTTAPDMDGANAPFWDATYSSGFYLYEVNAPLHNTITFKADSKGTGNYATFYNYYPTAVPAGATAYTASNSATAGYITLDELAEGIIPAKTAVVLKSETLTSATLHTGLQTADIDVSTNILQGSLMDDFNPGNIYVLSGTATDGVGFYKLKAAEDIPAFRAYYISTSSAPAFFFGNGPTTAVELNAATAAAEGKTFDLSGREVNKAARGLYIINGKKVVK